MYLFFAEVSEALIFISSITRIFYMMTDTFMNVFQRRLLVNQFFIPERFYVNFSIINGATSRDINQLAYTGPMNWIIAGEYKLILDGLLILIIVYVNNDGC